MKEYEIYTSTSLNRLTCWIVFGRDIDDCINKLRDVYHINEEIIAFKELSIGEEDSKCQI